MDQNGHIYMLSDEERGHLSKEFREMVDDQEREQAATLREDVARLEGYLRAQAEADAPKRARKA